MGHIEIAVSKRKPISGIKYSSESYSISVSMEQLELSNEIIRSKAIALHEFLTTIINNQIGLSNQQPELVTPISKPPRLITDKQKKLIMKLLATNQTLDRNDLFHAMEQAYNKNDVETLTVVEASNLIEALQSNNINKI
jgi:hypothetical protein